MIDLDVREAARHDCPQTKESHATRGGVSETTHTDTHTHTHTHTQTNTKTVLMDEIIVQKLVSHFLKTPTFRSTI